MAVGAKDKLDILLVKKYKAAKVDNPIIESSMIDPEKMYSSMNDYANMQRLTLNLKEKLRQTCANAMAPSVSYRLTSASAR